MSNEIPECVELKRETKTMYIVGWEKTYVYGDDSKYATSLQGWEPSEGTEHILLGTIEVDYEIPTDDRFFDAKQIEMLQAKKQAIIAKSRAEQTEIEAKIQGLMAIEHTPEAAA